MVHLIDKDALVAEIDKRTKEHHSGYLVCLKDILSFINTLEVKEVDLDFTKEVDVWVKDNGDTNDFFNVQELAKHFYELGLKTAQKGE